MVSTRDQIDDFIAASERAVATLGPARARAVNHSEHSQTANVALHDGGLLYVRWKQPARRRPDPVVLRWSEVTSFGVSEGSLQWGGTIYPIREMRIAATSSAGEQMHTIALIYHWVKPDVLTDAIARVTFPFRVRRREGGVDRGEPWPGAAVSISADGLVVSGRRGRVIGFGHVQAVAAQSHRRGARLVADIAGPDGVTELVLGKLADLGDTDVLATWIMDRSRRARGLP